MTTLKTCSFLLLLGMSALLSGCDSESSRADLEGGSLVIRHVSVISVASGEVLLNRDVLVVKGRISAISGEDGQKVEIPADAEEIDGSGKFLIPGLIDAHVHVGSMAGMSSEQRKNNQELANEYFRQQPRSYLYFGFTTVVDLLSTTDSRAAFTAGEDHPDLFHCGQALILEDGYPAVYVPRDVRQHLFPNLIWDSRVKDHTPGVTAENNSVEKAIARVKEAGGIAVKTFYEDGFADPIWPVPTAEMLREMRDVSHRSNLKFLVHANSFSSYQAVLDAGGADAFAHGMWNWDAYRNETGLNSELKVVLDRMVGMGVAQMGTTQVIVGLRDLFDESYLSREPLAKVLPPDYLAWLKSPQGAWYRNSLREDYPEGMSGDAISRELEAVAEHGRQSQIYFFRHGGMILFGSDTPSAPLYTNAPGYNGFLELQQMAGMGISLPDILKSATINNARFFGLNADLGSVEAGKIANLLLLSGNPLQSAEAYSTIDLVILRGRVISRNQLAADAHDTGLN